MTKPSPGPWEVGQRGDLHAGVWDAKGKLVCQFGNGIDQGWCEYKNADANARLTAAAPELLQACTAILAMIDRAKGQPVTFYEGMKNSAVTKLRAAVAKAEGARQ
jgi:hypothetical protein